MIRHIITQPSIEYYTWQVELLIHNLMEIGVNPNYIDIVSDTQDENGKWSKLANHYNYVRFFFYPDDRKNPSYTSSIRPHLLEKHFKSHPYLKNETIFYHDNDIFFTRPYDSSKLEQGDTWFLSDTISYIGYEYIKGKGELVFQEMCKIVNIDPQIVINNQKNSGGAQYIMKNVDYQYWADVYEDCEHLFSQISELNHKIKRQNSRYHELQIWCADMWAVLWNAWKRGYKTEIHNDLDFSWATSGIHEWSEKMIYHNAGVTNNTSGMFYKGDFMKKTPFNIDELDLNPGFCSYNYFQAIKKMKDKTILS